MEWLKNAETFKLNQNNADRQSSDFPARNFRELPRKKGFPKNIFPRSDWSRLEHVTIDSAILDVKKLAIRRHLAQFMLKMKNRAKH